MTRIALFSVLFLSSLAVAGCAADTTAEEDAPATTTADVIGGTETYARPEIGMLRKGNTLCTATLVRPNVVLSAMHCTGIAKDEDLSKAPTPSYFVIKTSAAKQYVYRVDKLSTITVGADLDGSQEWRAKDIAILRLATDVPSTVAKPAGLAPTWPWPGANVAIYGYGCTNRDDHVGAGTKRKKDYRWTLGLAIGWSDTQNTCPGDSGGPLLDTDRNMVLGTTSGYVNGDDKFGDVPRYYTQLSDIADAWWPRR